MLTGGRYRFGDFELRLGTRELRRGNSPVALGGRAFDLLACLVQNSGRTIGKDELLQAAWPGRVVIENNLNAQVRALRKLLGPATVVTVSGRGFRFGLDVRGELAPLHPPGAAPPPELPALAVLPFQNLSGDPAEDYFASGVAEDILTALSRFKQFRVLARHSSFALHKAEPELGRIGDALGVGYVLRGSVRRAQDRLRIHAQLCETAQLAQLWSARWDGAPDDLFQLQDDIAAKVALSIAPAIQQAELAQARRKRPENQHAHDLVLQALPHLYAMRPEDNRQALALLQAALALDPGYAWAQAHAAWCYEQRLSRAWPHADESQRVTAVSLARHALAAAGDDAIIVGLAGFVLFAVGRDHESGLAALRRATALNPHAALVANLAGTAHLFGGDLQEARAQLERLRHLNPIDPAAFMFISALACVRLLLGQPRPALALCAESVAANPDWDFTWWVTAAAAGEAGDTDRAREALDNLLRIGPDSCLSLPRFRIFREPQRREQLLAGLRKAGLGA
jgi:TolB-like protein